MAIPARRTTKAGDVATGGLYASRFQTRELFVGAYLRRHVAWFQARLGAPGGGAEGLKRVFAMHTHRPSITLITLPAALREAGSCYVERPSLNGRTIPELRVDNDELSRAPVQPPCGGSTL